jgi:hypothetical protein
VCKIVLIGEWILITTPNAILGGGALVTNKDNFPRAYGYMQRIEPTVYACVSLMLSCLYIYHAYKMFRLYGDKQVRHLLVRLLYANIFLIVVDSICIVTEYVWGGIVNSAYVAFFYSFVRCHQ